MSDNTTFDANVLTEEISVIHAEFQEALEAQEKALAKKIEAVMFEDQLRRDRINLKKRIHIAEAKNGINTGVARNWDV